MTILIADDVGLIRKQLQHTLGRTEHEILVAEDGHRALKLLRSNPAIEIVLTDLLMPGLNGVDLFAESKKIERYTDDGTDGGPDFVLLTGVRPSTRDNREIELLQQAAQLGFAKMIPKPVNSNQLLEAVEEIAARRAAPASGDEAAAEFAAVSARLAELADRFGRERVRELVEEALVSA